MKCSKCGKSFRDIKAIGAHYRKSHPGAMKARKPRTKSMKSRATAGDAYGIASMLLEQHIREYH